MNNKTIRIEFKLCNCLDNYIYKIKIYDYNNNLILYNLTDEFGGISFNYTYYGIYRINVFNYEKKISNWIMLYIGNKSKEKIVIFLDKSIKTKDRSITIKLTDQFYQDLPIMKGKMILWQKNI